LVSSCSAGKSSEIASKKTSDSGLVSAVDSYDNEWSIWHMLAALASW
jgi:hypothetical protein